MTDRRIPNEPGLPAPFHAQAANYRVVDKKVPPHNLDAERALLGAMLLIPTAIDQAAKILGPEDFYLPSHGVIFDAMVALRARGVDKPDPTLVEDYLLRAGTMELVGGGSVLTDLQGGTPRTTNADLYATAIAGYASRRRLIAIGQDVSNAAWSDDMPGASVALDRATDLLGKAAAGATSTWDCIDLSAVGETSITPGFWWRDDGVGLIYPAAINSFLGASESFKSFGAIAAARQTLDGGSTVLYIDHEDNPARMVDRMTAVGIDVLRYWAKGSLAYIRPDESPSTAAVAALAARLWGLVIVDGVTEAMNTAGLSLLDNQEVAQFYARHARPFAAVGSAVVLIDHVPKTNEGGPVGAIGGQHKRAGIDGASLLFTVIHPPSAETEGLVRITVDKDRHYGIREHASGKNIGTMRLIPGEAGRLRVAVEAPAPGARRMLARGDPNPHFVPTEVMSQIMSAVRILQAEGLDATGKRIDERVRSKVKGQALDLLLTGGYLEVRREGSRYLHRILKSFNPETYERDAPRRDAHRAADAAWHEYQGTPDEPEGRES